MGRGVHRGFITHEELSKSLGKRNLSDQNLAQAFLHILDEKIVLVEKKSEFKVLKKIEKIKMPDQKSKEDMTSLKMKLKSLFTQLDEFNKGIDDNNKVLDTLAMQVKKSESLISKLKTVKTSNS